MAKYRKSFELNLKDVDLIEESLRKQMALEATGGVQCNEAVDRLRNIQSLLGKIHHQKIFYSAVNPSQQPRG